jgi:hypothetical protein
MKLQSLAALTVLALSTLAHAATPEQEKAFVESYKKAFESKDEKALKDFLYTEGAPAQIVEMFTMMSLEGAGQKISKIELVTPTREEAARYNEPREMPDGKMYKMPFLPSKQLVVVIESKSEGGSTNTSTTKKPVGEKDGKLVIPVPVPAKAAAPAPAKKKK